jgi:hypothetical protein
MAIGECDEFVKYPCCVHPATSGRAVKMDELDFWEDWLYSGKTPEELFNQIPSLKEKRDLVRRFEERTVMLKDYGDQVYQLYRQAPEGAEKDGLHEDWLDIMRDYRETRQLRDNLPM